MAINTGHVCPHCDHLELLVVFAGGEDVPNGAGSYYSPPGYIVQCAGVPTGECDSPDLTGKFPEVNAAIQCAVDELAGWKPDLIGAFVGEVQLRAKSKRALLAPA